MAQIASKRCDFSCNAVAVFYCRGCNQGICVNCKQNVHDKVQLFKDHEVVNIQKEGTRVFRPHPVCDTHKNTFLCYCIRCDCLTCADCMTSNHNEHKTEKIKTVADVRRENVNQILEQLKTKVKFVKEKLATIDTKHSFQIKSDSEYYATKAEETTAELHTIIDRHKLIHMTTASDFKYNENQNLDRKKAFFQRRHDETADRILKFKNILQETHDSTFLTEWNVLQTDVQLIDEETDNQLLDPSRIEIFNQKMFTKSVIEDIDQQFQMGLKERENTVDSLTEEMGLLKDELKTKEQEQVDDLSKLSRQLKEKDKRVTKLLDENGKLKTEISESKQKQFVQLKENEKKAKHLQLENDTLKADMKLKQEEIDKLSNLIRDHYQIAHTKKLSQQERFEEMNDEMKVLEVGIDVRVKDETENDNKLKKKPLLPEPLDTVRYIELMIESEMREKRSGFNLRVKALEQCKKSAVEIRKTRVSLKASTVADGSVSSAQTEIDRMTQDKITHLFFG